LRIKSNHWQKHNGQENLGIFLSRIFLPVKAWLDSILLMLTDFVVGNATTDFQGFSVSAHKIR
jgi:hypothetical protein